MKILCLHGYGTNAAVLENQLQTFLSIADKDIETFYLEGEIEAPKAASKDEQPTCHVACMTDIETRLGCFHQR